jgi:hypothetical protein
MNTKRNHRPKRSGICLIALIAVLLSTSCQGGKELHYFKEGNNYYRLTIREHAFLSSSRYISGYFDEAAVDRYFGEVKRPDSAKVDQRMEHYAQNGEKVCSSGDKLVLVLSTNANAVTDQITALANNEQMLEMVARLAHQDDLDKNVELKAEQAVQQALASDIVQYGTATVGGMDPATLAADERATAAFVLEHLNQMAALLGAPARARTIPEALELLNDLSRP